jgi:hypothetical protein
MLGAARRFRDAAAGRRRRPRIVPLLQPPKLQHGPRNRADVPPGVVHCGAARRVLALVACTLLTTLLPVAAQANAAAGGGEYLAYTVRAGDTLYGVAQRLLDDRRQWRALQARNGVRNPRRLQPGSKLQVPIAWLRRENLYAIVVAAEGEVRARARGAEINLGPGVQLPAETRITTGAPGAITLRLVDGSTIEVQAATEVELRRLQRVIEASTHDDQINVSRGRIAVSAPPRTGAGARFEVITPRAVTGVRGTTFRIGSSDDASLVEVLGGGVASRGRQEGNPAASIDGGQGAVFDGSSAAVPRVVKLLPAPGLATPPTLSATPGSLPIDPVEGAQGYRAQLALDSRFERVIDESASSAPVYRTPDLADGSYWIRVRAVDGNGLEGFDAVAPVVVSARPRPPFPAAAPGYGNGPATSVRFDWTAAEGAAAYRFVVARDAAMTDVLHDRRPVAATSVAVDLPLADADYFWRVASIDAGGKAGPWGAIVKLERRPQPARLDAPALDDSQLVLRWAGVEGQRYRVQFARDAAFADDVRELAVAEPSLSIARPGPGSHYLRVRAVDAAGNAGPWSDSQRIDIPFDYTPLLLLLLFTILVL